MTEKEIISNAVQILESRLQKPSHFITATEDAKTYLKLLLSELEYESFRVLFLDNQHGVLETKEMFKGTINHSAVYPREVVKAALNFNAAAVILTHNHPSGHCEPSNADIAITERLKQAMGLIDIRVLDHIVVGGNNCYSFTENGLI